MTSIVPDPIDGISYLGSKGASGAYQAIIASMPPHDTYIEPFLGSGVVMRNKPRAEYSIGIDVNAAAVSYVAMRYRAPSNSFELSTIDAFDYLTRLDFENLGRVFIYCDPPYLWSTRTSNKRYRHELTDQDHLRLLELLKTLASRSAAIAISGYPSCCYDEHLADWRSIEFQVMTRGGPRTEKLWMSYPDSAVHWCSYAGSNFTDRQRVKRKASRWASNYASMPAAERLAVLSAILSHHQQTDTAMSDSP